MAKQSQVDIDQMIQYARPINRDLIRRDINQAINSPISHFLLKVAPYFYGDGTSKELLCLYGTIACQYKGNQYNIPIEIWLQQEHPNIPPLAYVKPTPDMYVSPSSKDVLPDGTIIIPYLKNWHQPGSDMPVLLQAISQAFSQSPPLYSNSGSTNYSTPYPTTICFPNPQVSPFPYNASTLISNAYLPFSNASISASNTFLSPTHSSTSNMASNNINEHNPTHRFSDVTAEPQRVLLPIQGFENMPLVSLEEAVKPLVSLVPDVEHMVWIAKQNCSHPKDDLSPDESASIMLYTIEWEPYEKSFYVVLNTALRAARREALKPWFSFLRLIINALQKLPSSHHITYRGVKTDLTAQYRRGDTIVWWGFSSCTSSIETLDNEHLLGKSGIRTIFSIECESGKNIRSHAFYGDEDEVLLLPGRQFEVIDCIDQGNELHIVQLKETEPKFPLIKFPSS